MRAINDCFTARSGRAPRAAAAASAPHVVPGALQAAGRAGPLVHAGEGTQSPPHLGRGRQRQGRRRRAQHVAPRDVALARQARAARLCRTARVREGPPRQARPAAPRRTSGARRHRAGAGVRAGGADGHAVGRRAGRVARRTPPHRGKDPLSVTQRLRLSESNRRWWTLGAMCFALFMIMLDNTVVNVALPSIQRDFDASLSALEWTINAYTLTFAVLLVTGGRLGDIFGRRLVFLIGVGIFAVASATIGFAPSDGFLVASRALQGVGAALMMPGTLSIISNAFPPRERGKAIGIWAGVSAIAGAIGPLVGGWLTEDVSWRAIFFLNVPVAVGAIAVTLFAAEESRDDTVDRRVDWPGIAALTAGLTALVLALVEANAWGWGSARIVGLFAFAVVALAGFVAIERRSLAPVVDFALFRSRQFLGANVVAF